MSLNIKNDETHQLVRELAELTGETQTMAVTVLAGTPHPGFVNPSVAQITATSSTTSEGFPRDHRHIRPHSDSSRRK